MKQGTLFRNDENGRIGVCFADGDINYGLHYGQCLDAWIIDKWTPTRIEYRNDWCLVGCYDPGQIPCNLKVRM